MPYLPVAADSLEIVKSSFDEFSKTVQILVGAIEPLIDSFRQLGYSLGHHAKLVLSADVGFLRHARLRNNWRNC